MSGPPSACSRRHGETTSRTGAERQAQFHAQAGRPRCRVEVVANSTPYTVANILDGSRADTRKCVSPKSSIGALSSRGYSSAISPTIALEKSSMPDRPSDRRIRRRVATMLVSDGAHFRQQRSTNGLLSGTRPRRGDHLRHVMSRRPLSAKKVCWKGLTKYTTPTSVVEDFRRSPECRKSHCTHGQVCRLTAKLVALIQIISDARTITSRGRAYHRSKDRLDHLRSSAANHPR